MRRGWRWLGALLCLLTIAVAACGGSSTSSPDATEIDHRAVSQEAAAAASEPAAAPAPTTPPSTLPPAPPPVAERVLMVGDSGMVDLSAAMAPMFLAAGADEAERHGLMGLGLYGIAFSDEPSPWREIWGEAIDRLDPDLVIGVMGGWDARYLDSRGLVPYTELVHEATALLSSRGAKVVWLSPLPGGEKDLPPRLSEAYAAMPAQFPGVAYYVDARPALTDPTGAVSGRFVDTDGTTVRLRKADDWHLCQDGAIRLSKLVNQWTVAWHLSAPAVPGWEKGPWWDDSTYDGNLCWPHGAWRS